MKSLRVAESVVRGLPMRKIGRFEITVITRESFEVQRITLVT